MPSLPRRDQIVNLRLSKETNKDREIVAQTIFDIEREVNKTGLMPDLTPILTNEQIRETDKYREILVPLTEEVGHIISTYKEFKPYCYNDESRTLEVGYIEVQFRHADETLRGLLKSLNEPLNQNSQSAYKRYLSSNRKKYFKLNTQSQKIMHARKYLKEVLSKSGIDDFFAFKSGLTVNTKYR